MTLLRARAPHGGPSALKATSSAPTGTVTFLFTDIEGSTKLWERHADAMQEALARHDAILRGVTGERDGYVFKTVGDAFAAPSPRPPTRSEPPWRPRGRSLLKKAGPRRRDPSG